MKRLISLALVLCFCTFAHATGADKDGKPMEAGPEVAPTADQALERFTQNFTQKAKAGKLPPFVGKRQQVRKVLETLSLAGNKSMFLLGDAGTGKTALAEYAAGFLPDGVEMFSLDLNALTSGTTYRGEEEARVKALLEAFIDNPKRILFIDEFHSLIKKEDLVTALKKPMARGQISILAATTEEEFRDHVEKDEAFTSRAAIEKLPKPTLKDVLDVLRANVENFEKHHGIPITDAALEAAAKLTLRYYSYKPVLRKAIEIVDRTAAREVLARQFGSFDLLKIQDEKESAELNLKSQRRSLKLDPSNVAITQKIENLEDEISVLDEKLKKIEVVEELRKANQLLNEQRAKATEAERKGALTDAAKLRNDVIPYLEAHIKELGAEPTTGDMITEKHIAKYVAVDKGMSTAATSETDIEKLKRLNETWKKEVIGQDHAGDVVTQKLKVRLANVEPVKGPIAVLLFDGPTGNGKTRGTQLVAKSYYGTIDKLTQIQLNQHGQNGLSRLLGSDPGIMDSEKGGELDALRRDGARVLGFDEYDKAPAATVGALNQLMSEGVIKDPRGRTIDARDAIIILQANFTGDYAVYRDYWTPEQIENYFRMKTGTLNGLTRAEIDEKVIDYAMEMKGVPPEIRNRIDAKIIFNALTLEQSVEIARLNLKEQAGHALLEHGITVEFADSVAVALAKMSYEPEMGARPVERARKDIISDLLADLVINKEVSTKDIVDVYFSTAEDQKGGKMVAKVREKGTWHAKDLVFKSAVDIKAVAGRKAGEVGRPADPTDLKTVVDRAVKKSKKDK